MPKLLALQCSKLLSEYESYHASLAPVAQPQKIDQSVAGALEFQLMTKLNEENNNSNFNLPDELWEIYTNPEYEGDPIFHFIVDSILRQSDKLSPKSAIDMYEVASTVLEDILLVVTPLHARIEHDYAALVTEEEEEAATAAAVAEKEEFDQIVGP